MFIRPISINIGSFIQLKINDLKKNLYYLVLHISPPFSLHSLFPFPSLLPFLSFFQTESGRDFGREDSGFLAPLNALSCKNGDEPGHVRFRRPMVRSLDAWNFNKCGLRFVTAPCLTLVLRIQEVRLRCKF
ncbi:unnamed protein product [Rhizophagus irregularis]|nr:unnamed protein product [Rhizophagus irregularis]